MSNYDAAAPTSVWLTTRQFLVPVASPFGFLVVVVACCCLFGLISDPGVPPDATHRSLPRLDSRHLLLPLVAPEVEFWEYRKSSDDARVGLGFVIPSVV